MAKKLIGVSTNGTEVYICVFVTTHLRPATWMVQWSLADGACGMLSLGPMNEEKATMVAREMIENPDEIAKLRSGHISKCVVKYKLKGSPSIS